MDRLTGCLVLVISASRRIERRKSTPSDEIFAVTHTLFLLSLINDIKDPMRIAMVGPPAL